MSGLWTGLIPLILGSALVPIEIVVTIMLLGTPSRVRAAGAWVAGISVIGSENLPRATNVLLYLGFVLLAISPHAGIVGAAAFFPQRSKVLLDHSLRWLQDHNRILVIGLGLVFGIWFLVTALHGFGFI